MFNANIQIQTKELKFSYILPDMFTYFDQKIIHLYLLVKVKHEAIVKSKNI